MRKAKKKTGSRTKKPAATKENQSPVLKERLEAEFAQAVKSAKTYVGNPQRLQSLFQEAAKQAASMPRDPFSEAWRYFRPRWRLFPPASGRNYRAVPRGPLVGIVAGIRHLVTPPACRRPPLRGRGFLLARA